MTHQHNTPIRRGTDCIIEGLRRENVDTIFGYPGAAMIPLFDALHDVTDIRFIMPRHEQGGIHAAEGYARATGKPGIVFVTSGPGATNLVTGIADAYMDSTPLVIFTGQVKRHLIGNDAFQEVDTTGITRPITKHNYLVSDPEELPRIITEAFFLATHGRPGPVLIDLPVDITTAEISAPFPESISIPGFHPRMDGHDGQIRRAAEAINKAQQPVLLAGGGIVHAGASRIVTELARKAGLPVSTTLMGLGTFPGDDPLALGMPGMHGTFQANQAITASDCLISIGARFDDRVTGNLAHFAPNATIIHIDIDPTSVGKSVPVDIPIIGDAASVCATLLPMLDAKKRPAWLARIAEWKAEHPLDTPDRGMHPSYILKTLFEIIGTRKTIICTEVGQHQMWTALYGTFREPRTLITSGGLGTMGFGLPAAMGAQIARPDYLVINIAGDGSIQMNMQEFATIANHGLPVKTLILDNGHLGMVRQWQELFYDRRYAQTILDGNPDFVKLADAFGIPAKRITTRGKVSSALDDMLSCAGPYLLDMVIEQEANVFPMVPAGEGIHRAIANMAVTTC